jgi:predicted enzyme related to lactoylglutathione lyase
MPEYTEHVPGTFCWVDLATTDAQGGKKFYSELFGWTAKEEPAGAESVYVRFSQAGKSVAALYSMSQEMRDQNIPPHWLSYVSVVDADETAARARELGGMVQMDPFDVFDVGRMTVIQDPSGAHFAIWQPKKHKGAELRNEPVSLCWNEVLTNDVDKAGEFYTKLFGWRAETENYGDFDYTMFMVGDQAAGGMMAIQEEMGDIPPHWAIYFAVEDCDVTSKRARELGGKVLVTPQDIQGVGKFAFIEDPQEAVFAIIKMAQF